MNTSVLNCGPEDNIIWKKIALELSTANNDNDISKYLEELYQLVTWFNVINIFVI